MKRGYRPELDGIRAVAIVGVLVDHSLRPNGGGTMGVVLFFVLSGYLITSLLADEHQANGAVDLRRFYLRRWARLTPALWMALVPLLCAPLVVPVTWHAVLAAAAAAFGYVTNIVRTVDPRAVNLTSWSWSLALEEQFYLLWPLGLLLILRRRWTRRAVWVLAAAVLLINLARPSFGPAVAYYAPPLRADALLAGCALALSGRYWPAWAGWAGLAALGGMYAVAGAPQVMLGAATLASLMLVASAARLRWLLAARPLPWLGGISYALYVWSSLLEELWKTKTGSQPSTAAAIGGWLVVSVLLAWASTRLVEDPIRRWARRGSAVAPAPMPAKPAPLPAA